LGVSGLVLQLAGCWLNVRRRAETHSLISAPVKEPGAIDQAHRGGQPVRQAHRAVRLAYPGAVEWRGGGHDVLKLEHSDLPERDRRLPAR
jgi:hypothetical protein